MKEFLLHWRDGEIDFVTGNNIADAMTKAGYGAGAIKALDFWEEARNTKNNQSLKDDGASLAS